MILRLAAKTTVSRSVALFTAYSLGIMTACPRARGVASAFLMMTRYGL